MIQSLLSHTRIWRWQRAYAMGSLLALGYLVAMKVTGVALPGVMTAVALVWATASSGCVASYARERGVWMMSALLVSLGCSFAGLAAFALACDLLAGRIRGSGVSIDFVIASLIFFASLWAVASAGIWNWRTLHRRRNGTGPPSGPTPPDFSPVPKPVRPRPSALSTHANV